MENINELISKVWEETLPVIQDFYKREPELFQNVPTIDGLTHLESVLYLLEAGYKTTLQMAWKQREDFIKNHVPGEPAGIIGNGSPIGKEHEFIFQDERVKEHFDKLIETKHIKKIVNN